MFTKICCFLNSVYLLRTDKNSNIIVLNYIVGVSIVGSQLSGGQLSGGQLSGGQLSGVNCQGQLSGGQLSGVNCRGVTCRGFNCRGSIVEGQLSPTLKIDTEVAGSSIFNTLFTLFHITLDVYMKVLPVTWWWGYNKNILLATCREFVQLCTAIGLLNLRILKVSFAQG